MIFRQPFAQAWRQQQLLLRQVGSVALWHKTLCNGSVHFRPANLRIPVGALSGAGRYYSDRLLESRISRADGARELSHGVAARASPLRPAHLTNALPGCTAPPSPIQLFRL